MVAVLLSTALLACSQGDSGPGPEASPSSSSELVTSGQEKTDSAASSQPAPPLTTSGSAAIAIAESAVAGAPAPTSAPDAATVVAPREASQEATPGPDPTTSTSPEHDTLLQLIDPLDEPEFYCVDVPGFRDSLQTDRPLQAHTCKPGADDELFLFNRPADGQISMPAYDLCMEAEGDLVLYPFLRRLFHPALLLWSRWNDTGRQWTTLPFGGSR